MDTERIAKLREEYTDQYVMVEADRPELARFRGAVGQVRTVNFSGRALVQFDQNNNRGRYDIELDYLKVVDKPEPKPPPAAGKAGAAKATAKAKSADKPAAEKKPAPAEKPEQKLSDLELARLEKAKHDKEQEGQGG